MKKVLIFSLQYYPLVGGAEVALKEITNRISPADVTFHMVTLRFNKGDARRERIGNVEVHRVGFGGAYISKVLFVPLAALSAAALNRRERFDGVWAMMSYMTFPLVLARFFGVRAPYIITLQDGDPFERVFGRWFIRPFLPLLRHAFQNAAVVTTLSAYLAHWAKTAGYPREPVIVPNGADIARFGEAHAAEIGRREGDVWLVTSSRLVYKNAIDDVIRALALLPETVRFLICGSGPEEKALKELAEEVGVAERITFKGYVSHETLPSFLKACDIFIRPSRTEGFGASFTEAMAAGLPIIATQEGGIADFLFDAERNPEVLSTGFAVNKDAPEEIAGAVRRIIENPAATAKVVANAARLVREKYDWDVIAKQMQGVLLKVCG